MKNIRQIEIINRVLENKRKKHLLEISRLNRFIDTKLGNIKKILSYQSEYTDEARLKLTRTVPSLSNNLESFTQKMTDIINTEQIEIQKLNDNKRSIMAELEKIDGKISVVKNFEKQVKLEKQQKIEQIEQLLIDDLSSTKKSRGNDNE